MKVGHGLPSLRASSPSITDDEEATKALAPLGDDDFAATKVKTSPSIDGPPKPHCPPSLQQRSSAAPPPLTGRKTLPEPAVERAKTRERKRIRIRRRAQPEVTNAATVTAAASSNRERIGTDLIHSDSTSIPALTVSTALGADSAKHAGSEQKRLRERTIQNSIIAALSGACVALLGTLFIPPSKPHHDVSTTHDVAPPVATATRIFESADGPLPTAPSATPPPKFVTPAAPPVAHAVAAVASVSPAGAVVTATGPRPAAIRRVAAPRPVNPSSAPKAAAKASEPDEMTKKASEALREAERETSLHD
jgi:hypothetical protein